MYEIVFPDTFKSHSVTLKLSLKNVCVCLGFRTHICVHFYIYIHTDTYVYLHKHTPTSEDLGLKLYVLVERYTCLTVVYKEETV